MLFTNFVSSRSALLADKNMLKSYWSLLAPRGRMAYLSGHFYSLHKLWRRHSQKVSGPAVRQSALVPTSFVLLLNRIYWKFESSWEYISPRDTPMLRSGVSTPMDATSVEKRTLMCLTGKSMCNFQNLYLTKQSPWAESRHGLLLVSRGTEPWQFLHHDVRMPRLPQGLFQPRFYVTQV